jgi:hypothetical protein
MIAVRGSLCISHGRNADSEDGFLRPLDHSHSRTGTRESVFFPKCVVFYLHRSSKGYCYYCHRMDNHAAIWSREKSMPAEPLGARLELVTIAFLLRVVSACNFYDAVTHGKSVITELFQTDMNVFGIDMCTISRET